MSNPPRLDDVLSELAEERRQNAALRERAAVLERLDDLLGTLTGVLDIRGMRVFARESLVRTAENLETANAGGGVKVMFGQWGLRADYRFVGFDAVGDNTSTFIGSDVRHAHRISAGFIIAPGRGVPRGNQLR
jgi:hypothetical protein